MMEIVESSVGSCGHRHDSRRELDHFLDGRRELDHFLDGRLESVCGWGQRSSKNWDFLRGPMCFLLFLYECSSGHRMVPIVVVGPSEFFLVEAHQCLTRGPA